MEPQKNQVCIIPGCKEPRKRNGIDRHCPEHLKEYFNALRLARNTRFGCVGVECLICHKGPYVKLGNHTFPIHGVRRSEYLRMFPGANMSHPDQREAWALELSERGFTPGFKRQTVCKRGHPLRAPNLIVDRDGGRRCRRCDETRRSVHVQKRREQAGTKPCDCGCGTEIFALTTRLNPARFAKGHNPWKPRSA